ncbi:hypothetical protein [Rhodovulum sp. MB263]|uniref:hypothetical protein n=1 Tax=Rhodovulum sp. (strain MB263) TaxID=308754 RepID=UPI0012DAF9F6|nr:hypothetical protein [Rhodovulum sp. MB263]
MAPCNPGKFFARDPGARKIVSEIAAEPETTPEPSIFPVSPHRGGRGAELNADGGRLVR